MAVTLRSLEYRQAFIAASSAPIDIASATLLRTNSTVPTLHPESAPHGTPLRHIASATNQPPSACAIHASGAPSTPYQAQQEGRGGDSTMMSAITVPPCRTVDAARYTAA